MGTDQEHEPERKRWAVHVWEWFWEFLNAEKLGAYLKSEFVSFRGARFLFIVIGLVGGLAGYLIRGHIAAAQIEEAKHDNDATIQDQRKQIGEIKDKLAETRRERDKAELQLAPWIELANTQFTNTPTNKRLEELLNRVQANVEALNDISSRLPKSRLITLAASEEIIAQLRNIPPMKVAVQTIANDSEAGRVSEQIEEVFRKGGHFVTTSSGIYVKTPEGIGLTLRDQPSPALFQVLSRLVEAMNEHAGAGVDRNLQELGPTNTPIDLSILVGARRISR